MSSAMCVIPEFGSMDDHALSFRSILHEFEAFQNKEKKNILEKTPTTTSTSCKRARVPHHVHQNSVEMTTQESRR